MQFFVDGHFSGQASRSVNFLEHVPWVYIVTCLSDRVIYIGETYDRGGLIVRLSTHFGPQPRSTLRKQASIVAGIPALRGPYIVVAARLPTNDTSVRYDGSNMHVRRLIESILHERLAQYVSRRRGWVIVSNMQSSRAIENGDITTSCDSIAGSFEHAVEFLQTLAESSPVHLVTLSVSFEAEVDVDANELIIRIEVLLFEWLIERLKGEYGVDDWWMRGVPVAARTQCATRREQEGRSGTPIEAFLTLIDLRDVVRSNWQLFGQAMQSMTGEHGKDRSTSWIVEVNEVRKLWAHPIKQRFLPISQEQRQTIRSLVEKLSVVVSVRH